MFRLIEPSSGQIQNTVLVHSVRAHFGIPYCLQNYIGINDHLLANVFKWMYKSPVFKIYIKAYQYVFVKIMLGYKCIISVISTCLMGLLWL
jgi:hypothetical protein